MKRGLWPGPWGLLARLAVGLLVVLLAVQVAAQQRRWFELYDEAKQHVTRSEWPQAEAKLLEAKKLGPRPAASVLRYGSLREPFFPDFYLGIVYLNTNRATEALRQFQLSRSQGVNAQNREFQPIAVLEARAQTLAKQPQATIAGNTATPSPGGNPPPVNPPPIATPPVPADPLVASRARLDTVLPTARASLEKKDYASVKRSIDEMRQLRFAPPDVARLDLLERDLQIAQILDSGDAALANLDLPTARSVSQQLAALKADESLMAINKIRVGLIEVAMTRGSERIAMLAFYAGDYTRTISVLTEIERSVPLSTRGLFYRACGVAALSLRSDAGDQKGLIEARRQYKQALNDRQVIARDQRYISPRVLRLLTTGT